MKAIGAGGLARTPVLVDVSHGVRGSVSAGGRSCFSPHAAFSGGRGTQQSSIRVGRLAPRLIVQAADGSTSSGQRPVRDRTTRWPAEDDSSSRPAAWRRRHMKSGRFRAGRGGALRQGGRWSPSGRRPIHPCAAGHRTRVLMGDGFGNLVTNLKPPARRHADSQPRHHRDGDHLFGRAGRTSLSSTSGAWLPGVAVRETRADKLLGARAGISRADLSSAALNSRVFVFIVQRLVLRRCVRVACLLFLLCLWAARARPIRLPAMAGSGTAVGSVQAVQTQAIFQLVASWSVGAGTGSCRDVMSWVARIVVAAGEAVGRGVGVRDHRPTVGRAGVRPRSSTRFGVRSARTRVDDGAPDRPREAAASMRRRGSRHELACTATTTTTTCWRRGSPDRRRSAIHIFRPDWSLAGGQPAPLAALAGEGGSDRARRGDPVDAGKGAAGCGCAWCWPRCTR